MPKQVPVRFLIPRRVHPDGRVDYHVETRMLRLPLKRGDRQGMDQRFGEG